jgi:hypothetical protein
MKFPDDWPAGCPPADAGAADGDAYRLVRNDPPTADDFLTHHETGKLPNASPCLRCGLSVFRSRDDAEHQHRAYPRLGRFIARGTFQARDGVTLLTRGRQPTHTTWWPYEGVDRARIFSAVEEIV